MEQSPSSEADSSLGSQDINPHYTKPEVSSPCLQKPSNWPSPEPGITRV